MIVGRVMVVGGRVVRCLWEVTGESGCSGIDTCRGTVGVKGKYAHHPHTWFSLYSKEK
jgi:hypothetical protein